MSATSHDQPKIFSESYRIYIEDILQGVPLDDPRLPMVLTRFTTDPDWASVQVAVEILAEPVTPTLTATP